MHTIHIKQRCGPDPRLPLRKLSMPFALRCLSILSVLSCTWLYVATASETPIIITQTAADGIYATNEAIAWTFARGDIPPDQANQVHITIARSGKEIVHDVTVDLSDQPHTLTGSLDQPGSFFITAEVLISDKNKLQRVTSGSLIDPLHISPSLPKPDDFDAFWQEKLAEQEAVPMNPVLTPEKQDPNAVHTWTITMDTIRGQHIHGRVARPAQGDSLPAMLVVQWAGVYALDSGWAEWPASQGFLVLNIIAHDQPVNGSKEFFDALGKNELNNYTAIGNTSREESYFLRMCLAASRGVDYLASRPDWNGKVLVATGASQGGYQSIVAAGLNSKVTTIMANVPAGCDNTAPLANRAVGWPYWLAGGTDNDAKVQTSRYFDAMNFATNVTCPALIGFGFGDPTSRVEGVCASMNAMQGPVTRLGIPNSNHSGPNDDYKNGFEAWKKSLVETGRPPQ